MPYDKKRKTDVLIMQNKTYKKISSDICKCMGYSNWSEGGDNNRQQQQSDYLRPS